MIPVALPALFTLLSAADSAGAAAPWILQGPPVSETQRVGWLIIPYDILRGRDSVGVELLPQVREAVAIKSNPGQCRSDPERTEPTGISVWDRLNVCWFRRIASDSADLVIPLSVFEGRPELSDELGVVLHLPTGTGSSRRFVDAKVIAAEGKGRQGGNAVANTLLGGVIALASAALAALLGHALEKNRKKVDHAFEMEKLGNEQAFNLEQIQAGWSGELLKILDPEIATNTHRLRKWFEEDPDGPPPLVEHNAYIDVNKNPDLMAHLLATRGAKFIEFLKSYHEQVKIYRAGWRRYHAGKKVTPAEQSTAKGIMVSSGTKILDLIDGAS